MLFYTDKKDIANHYGKDKQSLQAVEEMAELTKELIKNVNRSEKNNAEIINEIIDVTIMIDQLIILFNIDFLTIEMKSREKIHRQFLRIAKEKK